MKIHHKIVFILLVAIGLQSCSSTKNLAEGELLYTGAKVTIEGQIPSKEKKALTTELKALTRPIPNKSLFGTYPKLYIYNFAGIPKKRKRMAKLVAYQSGRSTRFEHQTRFRIQSISAAKLYGKQGFFQCKNQS